MIAAVGRTDREESTWYTEEAEERLTATAERERERQLVRTGSKVRQERKAGRPGSRNGQTQRTGEVI